MSMQKTDENELKREKQSRNQTSMTNQTERMETRART